MVVVGDALIDELRDDRGVASSSAAPRSTSRSGSRRLGVPTSLIAMVGDDEDGAHIRAYLGDFGVELIATASPRRLIARGERALGAGEPEYEFNDAAKARRIRFGEAERAAIAGRRTWW